MDPISNVDGLILLLRRRMEERVKAEQAARGSRKPSPEAPAGSLAKVQELAHVEGVSDQQLGRSLIQNLLAEHLGQGLLNDANFQQIVDRVTATIQQEPEGSKLLTRMVRELRAA